MCFFFVWRKKCVEIIIMMRIEGVLLGDSVWYRGGIGKIKVIWSFYGIFDDTVLLVVYGI